MLFDTLLADKTGLESADPKEENGNEVDPVRWFCSGVYLFKKTSNSAIQQAAGELKPAASDKGAPMWSLDSIYHMLNLQLDLNVF